MIQRAKASAQKDGRPVEKPFVDQALALKLGGKARPRLQQEFIHALLREALQQ
jgi:hypothetical protein